MNHSAANSPYVKQRESIRDLYRSSPRRYHPGTSTDEITLKENTIEEGKRTSGFFNSSSANGATKVDASSTLSSRGKHNYNHRDFTISEGGTPESRLSPKNVADLKPVPMSPLKLPKTADVDKDQGDDDESLAVIQEIIETMSKYRTPKVRRGFCMQLTPNGDLLLCTAGTHLDRLPDFQMHSTAKNGPSTVSTSECSSTSTEESTEKDCPTEDSESIQDLENYLLSLSDDSDEDSSSTHHYDDEFLQLTLGGQVIRCPYEAEDMLSVISSSARHLTLFVDHSDDDNSSSDDNSAHELVMRSNLTPLQSIRGVIGSLTPNLGKQKLGRPRWSISTSNPKSSNPGVKSKKSRRAAKSLSPSQQTSRAAPQRAALAPVLSNVHLNVKQTTPQTLRTHDKPFSLPLNLDRLDDSYHSLTSTAAYVSLYA